MMVKADCVPGIGMTVPRWDVGLRIDSVGKGFSCLIGERRRCVAGCAGFKIVSFFCIDYEFGYSVRNKTHSMNT